MYVVISFIIIADGVREHLMGISFRLLVLLVNHKSGTYSRKDTGTVM